MQLVFGLWPVAGAAVLKLIRPEALVGYRLLLGAPLFALVAGILLRKPPPLKQLAQLAGLATLGIVANQILFIEGLKRAGPINAAILLMIVPALTLLVGTLLGREHPSGLRLLGVFVAIGGALSLVGVERFDFGNEVFLGNLMLAGNASAYALFLVFARPLIGSIGSLPTMAWVFVFGALEALPYYLTHTLDAPWAALPSWAYGSLAFILLGPTLLTYLLNGYALGKVESSVVAIYIYLQPMVASIAAWIFLEQVLTLRVLLSGSIIVVGVALATQVWRVLLPKTKPGSAKPTSPKPSAP